MDSAPQRFARPTDTSTVSVGEMSDAVHPERARTRRAFDIAAFGFFFGLVGQVLLAGWSLFNEPDRWAWHRQLGHSLEVVALIMVVLAFAGRLPLGRRRAAIALLLLTIVQGMLAGIGGVAGTLHPVNAVIMAVIAYRLVMRV